MTAAGKDPLSAQRRRFVEEYLKDPNATQAAILAGYSKQSAKSQGARLLTFVDVQKEIEKARKARAERVEIDADWVLKRLCAEAEADIADIYQDDGTLKPVSEWPKIWRQGLVSGIKVNELFDGTGKDRTKIGDAVELKISDRIKRVELIGKHIGVGAFKDKVEHDIADPMKDFMKAVSGRGIRPQGGG